MPDLRSFLRALHTLTRRHRRPLAAALAGAATFTAVHVLAPPPPSTVSVVVAAHDLTAGRRIDATDVRLARLPPAVVPARALTVIDSVLDRSVAAPMRTGEVFTDRRLVSASLLDGYGAGLRAIPVRIADRAAVGLLRVGDLIDVYAAAPGGRRSAGLVVSAARVVSLPAVGHDDGAAGALVVLAVSADDAAHLAQAGAVSALSLAMK